MADLFQGSPLPSVTETKQTQQVAPEFYTNYLQDIANLGQNAITQGGVAGLSPLQQQAINMAPTAAFAGSQTLGTASNMIGGAGTTTAPSVINQYMNPYTQNVVNEMSRLSQQNLQRNIMPALRAAGVGTGGFGSTRMANVTGQTLADVAANLTGQQYQALNTGYDAAMRAAQADLARQMQAGEGMAQTGQLQSTTSLNALKSLADLGLIDQATAQKVLDYPMAQTSQFAQLLQPYAGSIPTGTVAQTTGPGQQGQFANSPLSQIAGLMMALGSLYQGMGSGSKTNTPTTPQPAGNTPSKYLDNSGGINWGSIANDVLGGILNSDTVASWFGFADGGSVKGGLQSMLQGRDDNQNMNYNVPEPSTTMNSNVPSIGLNPPPVTAANLNYNVSVPDYQEVG